LKTEPHKAHFISDLGSLKTEPHKAHFISDLGSYFNMQGNDGAISWASTDLVNKSLFVLLKHPQLLDTTGTCML
jgi:hypothetical protein